MAPRFEPGRSGNPAGRPPDTERFLARLLRRHPDAWDEAARSVAAILSDPENRHFATVWKEALDRHEGPVASQAHHHVSTDRAIVTHAGPQHPPALPGAGSELSEPGSPDEAPTQGE